MELDRKAIALILIIVGIVAIIHSYAANEFVNIVSIVAGAIVLAIGTFSILSNNTLAKNEQNKVLAVILIFVGIIAIVFNYILVTISVNSVSIFAGAVMLGIGNVYLILAMKTEPSTQKDEGPPTPPTYSVEEIPIEVRNLVQFCWGTTLNLSHESTQSTLGSKILDTVLPEIKVDSKLKGKSLGLYMILSRTMRNIAFTRDAHVRHLDDQARRYNQTRDLLESIGEISFSKESIPYKLISFLFFGSGLQYVFGSDLPKGEEILTNNNTVSIITGVLNTTIPEDSKTSLVEKVLGLKQQAININDILSFVFFGVVGIIAVTVGFRIFTHVYLEWKAEKIKNKQNEYWDKNYIKDMTDILFRLYKDVNKLLYPTGGAVIEQHVIDWIKNEILPIAEIDWTIWIGRNKKDSGSKEN